MLLTPAFVRADALVPNLGDGYFPIGVFYQPDVAVATTSFAGWKARGINTLVGYESQGGPSAGGVSIQQYTTDAAKAGLYLIRQASSNPAQDTSPNIIAWLQPDEPDLRGITPAQLQATYDQLHAINPSRPILTNFAGGYMAYGYGGLSWVGWGSAPLGDFNSPNYIPYDTYMKGAVAAADWVAQDIYPVTGFLQPNLLGVVGDTTSRLINWTTAAGGPAKPAFSYIETSNQRLYSNSDPTLFERGVTPGEMRAEIWDSVIHGARGIMYFPQELDGFQYDATPVDVAAEMTQNNATITGIARALNSSEVSPFSSVSFDNPSIETLIKSYGGVTYLIALNLSNQPIDSTTFSLDPSVSLGDLTLLQDGSDIPNLGDNTFTDSFDAYGYKIYAAVPDGVAGALLSVPEPAGLSLLLAAPFLLARRRRNA